MKNIFTDTFKLKINKASPAFEMNVKHNRDLSVFSIVSYDVHDPIYTSCNLNQLKQHSFNSWKLPWT